MWEIIKSNSYLKKEKVFIFWKFTQSMFGIAVGAVVTISSSYKLLIK